MDFSIAAYPPLTHPTNVAYLTMRTMFRQCSSLVIYTYNEYCTKCITIFNERYDIKKEINNNLLH